MSFKRIFPERGTYDVTTSLSELQQRCNDLTNVITSTADESTGRNDQNDVWVERTAAQTSTSSSGPQTSTPMGTMQGSPNMHVDAIVEVGPSPNIGFSTFDTDNKGQKGDGDNLSNSSKNNKCENCLVDCIYYSNQCFDCKIL